MKGMDADDEEGWESREWRSVGGAGTERMPGRKSGTKLRWVVAVVLMAVYLKAR